MNTSSEKGHNNVGEIFTKSEKFIEKYQKQLIIGVGAVIVLVLAILGIRHAYLIPKEDAAEKAIFKGESYFANSQWDLALYGDSVDYIGFEEIINEYGITKTGDLARAYAGICYYHKGEPEKALEYLKKFDSNDNMVAPAILGLIGDCYVDLGKVKEGVDYFTKAVAKADNDLLSPIYLKKAGTAYENLQNYEKAVEVYSTIKDKYPNSTEASDIDKYIDRAKMFIK